MVHQRLSALRRFLRSVSLPALVLVPGLLSAAAAPADNLAAAIAETRRAWTDDARVIATLLNKIAATSNTGVKAETEHGREQRARRETERERDRTLEELRNGAFCTGCGKTRSVIEAAGETFPHPGQQRRPATPEELANAERGFKARLEVSQKRLSSLEAEINRAREEVQQAYHEFMVKKTPFQGQMAQEQAHRLGKWLNERTKIQEETAALRDAVATARAEVRQATDADQNRRAQAKLDELEKQFRQKANSGKLAEDRAVQEERTFRRDALGAIDHLADLAKPIPDRFCAGGWFIATNLRNPPQPVGYTVPAVFIGGPSLDSATAASGGLQELLDGKPTPKPGNPKPPGNKSVQDLLEGK